MIYTSVLHRIRTALGLQPQYLIRLDDACETHNIEKWKAMEHILDKHHIKPIVAVIPLNEDPSLHQAERNKQFWDDVRRWRDKGWAIALHGYRHVYHPVDKKQLIFPFYNRSEFAGLDLETQSELLKKACAKFAEHDIRPALWVAPGHCFDHVTLQALKRATDITVISDGIALFPFSEHGFTFVPQQLWRLKKKMIGTWTICLHPGTMSEESIKTFEEALTRLNIASNCINLQEAVSGVRQKSLYSRLYARVFWMRWNVSRH
jgi:predicted deacetylase